MNRIDKQEGFIARDCVPVMCARDCVPVIVSHNHAYRNYA